MIALIQRVAQARVEVDGSCVGEIGPGLLALIAVRPEDETANAQRLLERLLAYRVFSDAQGRMNLALRDTAGGLLLVPQFTLAADTRKGNRPSFSSAASPEHAAALFDTLYELARQQHPQVAKGQFGAEMMVSLHNHGPATFWIEA